jgi:hypothetical protein
MLSPILTDELLKYLTVITLPSIDPESNKALDPNLAMLNDHLYPVAAAVVAVAAVSDGAE